MLCHVVWYKLADVLEVITSSIIMAIAHRLDDAVSKHLNCRSVSNRQHGTASQKTFTSILAIVGT
jgi:hypothetical protein